MKYLLIIALIATFGCSTQKNDFEKYIDGISSVETPVSFSTSLNGKIGLNPNVDTVLYEKYKYSQADEIFGTIYKTDSSIGIIYIVYGDVLTPVLMTYDRTGIRVDSVNLFQNASGFDLEREVYVMSTLNSDRTISEIDTTITWRLNKDRNERIDELENFKVESVGYQVTTSGRINNVASKSKSAGR